MKDSVPTVSSSLDKGAHHSALPQYHASKKEILPGELYVTKSFTTAFVTPLITLAIIDSDVLIEWRALSLSLHQWNEKFFIATNASDKVPASLAALSVHETFFQTKALNFKTPAKQKRNQEEGESLAPSLLDISAYSLFSRTIRRPQLPRSGMSLEALLD
jgi:hypothetical protein